MSALVLDASTAILWCLEESLTPYATAVFGEIEAGADIYVPHIWPLEVTNALVKAYRRKHISRDELFEYGNRLSSLPIVVDTEEVAGRAFRELLPLAERRQLTTYDSPYVELALRLDLPLATADSNLLQAAKEVKAKLFQGSPTQ